MYLHLLFLAPEKPSFLRVATSNDTSFHLEWGHPNLTHGTLRSFLLDVEKVDSFRDEPCCKHIPVEEIPVSVQTEVYSRTVSIIFLN